MKKFFFVFSCIVGLFLAMNILLAFILTPINNFITINILNKSVYNNEALKIIGIEPSESKIFYNQSFTRKFKYLQFAEHYEKETKVQKYVNVTKNDGRKITNNNKCEKNFYFYGSSLTFGYNVNDSQTTPSYFKNILDFNFPDFKYCVFNFGSASYFSTQETILFQTHILDNRIKEDDFIFFIDGSSEQGNKKSRISDELNNIFSNGLNARMLGRLRFSFNFFWDSLPSTKIFTILKNKFRRNNNSKRTSIEVSENEIKEVFQKNILIRKGICNNFKLNCFTFLQPMPGNSPLQNNNFSKEKMLSRVLDEDKLALLRDVNHIFDISNSLEDIKSPFFIGSHYTPEANKSIAKSIYNIINKKLN
jgi:hypothetical protein